MEALFTEGMLVCVSWKDNHSFKNVFGSDWSNGEIRIFKSSDYYLGVINEISSV